MQELTQTYDIKASVEKVWAALTDPKVIDKWGGGPAVMDDEVSTEFSLWGGDIHGKNTEVEVEKTLVQEWYGGDWSAPSICEFSLEGSYGHTTLTLKQTNIPDDEFEEIEEGWHKYCLGPLQKFLEKAHH